MPKRFALKSTLITRNLVRIAFQWDPKLPKTPTDRFVREEPCGMELQFHGTDGIAYKSPWSKEELATKLPGVTPEAVAYMIGQHVDADGDITMGSFHELLLELARLLPFRDSVDGTEEVYEDAPTTAAPTTTPPTTSPLPTIPPPTTP